MKQPTDKQLRGSATLRPLDLHTAQRMVIKRHYLHRKVDAQARPLAYGIYWRGRLCGVSIYARPHFARYRGWWWDWDDNVRLPESGLPEGTPFTQWQVLVHSRLWISDYAPRNLESWAMAEALKPQSGHHVPRLVEDYLAAYPPIYRHQPFDIRLLVGWTHDSLHPQGTIYRAAGWFEADRTVGAAHRRHGGLERGDLQGTRTMYATLLPELPIWWSPRFRQPRPQQMGLGLA